MGRLQVSGKDGKELLLNFYRYWYRLALFSLYRYISIYLCAYCVCVCFRVMVFFFFVNSLVVCNQNL